MQCLKWRPSVLILLWQSTIVGTFGFFQSGSFELADALTFSFVFWVDGTRFKVHQQLRCCSWARFQASVGPWCRGFVLFVAHVALFQEIRCSSSPFVGQFQGFVEEFWTSSAVVDVFCASGDFFFLFFPFFFFNEDWMGFSGFMGHSGHYFPFIQLVFKEIPCQISSVTAGESRALECNANTDWIQRWNKRRWSRSSNETIEWGNCPSGNGWCRALKWSNDDRPVHRHQPNNKRPLQSGFIPKYETDQWTGQTDT